MPYGGPGAQRDALQVFLNRMTVGLTGDSSAAEKRLGRGAVPAALAGDIAGVVAPFKLLKVAKAGPGLAKVGRTVAAHPFKTAAAALGIGGLGASELATYGQNAEASPTKATPQPKAAPAKAASRKEPDFDVLAARIVDALRPAAESATPSFADVVGQYAAGQDGTISLRQLGALSETAQRGANADYYSAGGAKKAPAPGDAAGRMLEQMYVTQFQKSLKDQNADPVKAQQEFENKVLQLRKTQFIDPYGLQDGDQ